MKKNLSILVALMLTLGLLLTACGGAAAVKNDSIVGSWANDAGLTFTYAADGTYTTSEGGSGTYVLNGSDLSITAADGTKVSVTVTIKGDTLTETNSAGTSVTWKKAAE